VTVYAVDTALLAGWEQPRVAAYAGDHGRELTATPF
jgi:hypothetical protein